LAKKGAVQRIELPAIMTGSGITVAESTVDYTGHYSGYPVAFDTKECGLERINIKTNFKAHQTEFLKYWKKCCIEQPKVMAGYLIHFYKVDPDHLYFLDIDTYIEMDKAEKSVLYTDIKVILPFSEKFLEEYFNVFTRLR
jgi:penicillin-binding protein-related factor A (putative recombinase)